MTILINLLKSIGIIGLSIVFAFVAAVPRGFPMIKTEDSRRRAIILSIILACELKVLRIKQHELQDFHRGNPIYAVGDE